MRTITFYSYKGGVGRSLVVANVAKYLAMFGQKVVVIDFDLEAPGLHYKFSKDSENSPINFKNGLVDYIFPLIVKRKSPEFDIKDLAVKIETDLDINGSIFLIPAGNVFDKNYWMKLSMINWKDKFYSNKSKKFPEGICLFMDLKKKIENEMAPDYLLIDSRTGITEIGGVSTTILPDKVVCLFMNNKENTDGILEIIRCIKQAPRFSNQKPIEILPVLTRIPYGFNDEEVIAPVFNRFKNVIKFSETPENENILILHSDPEIEIYESIRVGSPKKPGESFLLRDYLLLCTKLINTAVIEPYIGSLIKQVPLSTTTNSNINRNDFKFSSLIEIYTDIIERHEKSKNIVLNGSAFRPMPKNSTKLFSRSFLEINTVELEKVCSWETDYENLNTFWVLLPKFLGGEKKEFNNAMISNIKNNNTHYIYFLPNGDYLITLENLYKELQTYISHDINENIRYIIIDDVILKEILKFTNYWVANPHGPNSEKYPMAYEVLFCNNNPIGGIPLNNDLGNTLVKTIESLVPIEKLCGIPIS